MPPKNKNKNKNKNNRQAAPGNARVGNSTGLTAEQQQRRERNRRNEAKRARRLLADQAINMPPISNQGDSAQAPVAPMQVQAREHGVLLPRVQHASTQTETDATNAQPPATPNGVDQATGTARDIPNPPAANNSMLNLALGGNTFDVDVPAAIGREVLKIFNSTFWQNEKLTKERDTLEKENQTLWENNKAVSEKNSALLEENISLKLLLAQRGISLEELSEFGIAIPRPQLEPAPPGVASRSIHTSPPLSLSSQHTPSTLSSTHALDKVASNAVVNDSTPSVAEAPMGIRTLEVLPQVNNTPTKQLSNVSETFPLDNPAPVIGENQDAGTITSNFASDPLSSTTVPVFHEAQDVPNAKRKVNDENTSPYNIDKKRQRLDLENSPRQKSDSTERQALSERRVQSINTQDKLIDDFTDAKMDMSSESDSTVARRHPSKTQCQRSIKSSDEHSTKDPDSKNLGNSKSMYEALEDVLVQFMRDGGQNKFFCRISMPGCGKGYLGASAWRKHVDRLHPEWLNAQIKELTSAPPLRTTTTVSHKLPSHQQEFFEIERQRERKREIENMVMELREELEDKGDDDVFIEVETGALRRKLLREFEEETEITQGLPHLPDPKLARARTDQLDRLRSALGINKTSREVDSRSTATSNDTRRPDSNAWKWDDDDDGNPQYHRLPGIEADMRARAAGSSNRDSMGVWGSRQPRVVDYDDPSEDAATAPYVLDYDDEDTTEKKQDSLATVLNYDDKNTTEKEQDPPSALFGGKVSFAFPKQSN